MTSTRKSSYKLPPTTIRDSLVSQHARRTKFLEEQKRRRSSKIETIRNLENFADLNIESDDDSDDTLVREGVGSFVSMLQDAGPSGGATPKPMKRKPINKWADKCMYAELLEMSNEDAWTTNDGLPHDLLTGWVAVAPVPVGKRCLAICYQSSGATGLVPNTMIRSRMLGKPLMAKFPSALPSDTILDCILDAHWRGNGILHVLDVLKWKGQDITDCETPFRFWWRDTRLAELSQLIPPSTTHHPDGTNNVSLFSYPITLLPIPYHTDMSYANLANCIIPLARTSRTMTVQGRHLNHGPEDMDMALESPQQLNTTVEADGLLLYVAEASYESGTSPLSSWVPIVPTDPGGESPLNVFLRLVTKRMLASNTETPAPVPEVEMS